MPFIQHAFNNQIHPVPNNFYRFSLEVLLYLSKIYFKVELRGSWENAESIGDRANGGSLTWKFPYDNEKA